MGYDILPNPAHAAGHWKSIDRSHGLVPMPDGTVIDYEADGTWRVWNYDPGNLADIFPGKPRSSGKWKTIGLGHLLVPMPDGKVLDWVVGLPYWYGITEDGGELHHDGREPAGGFAAGTWRLYNYDPDYKKDALPGNPVAKGFWKSIGSDHSLFPMPDGRILDLGAHKHGNWRPWNYDASHTSDVFPGDPVAAGKWNTIVPPHRLLAMSDGRVLDHGPHDKWNWRLYNYDASHTKDVLPGNPVRAGHWNTIGELIPMIDGRVLDLCDHKGKNWRLWNYKP